MNTMASELMTVTMTSLVWMDVLEGYLQLYRREAIQATLGDSSIKAAMDYVMNTLPRGAKTIADRDWRDKINSF